MDKQSGNPIPAFILMAVLPFSLFYDRTILLDRSLYFYGLAIVSSNNRIGSINQANWLADIAIGFSSG